MCMAGLGRGCCELPFFPALQPRVAELRCFCRCKACYSLFFTHYAAGLLCQIMVHEGVLACLSTCCDGCLKVCTVRAISCASLMLAVHAQPSWLVQPGSVMPKGQRQAMHGAPGAKPTSIPPRRSPCGMSCHCLDCCSRPARASCASCACCASLQKRVRRILQNFLDQGPHGCKHRYCMAC